MRVLRFLTILFVALSTGMAFCHLLEMPARLDYEPALWSLVTNVEGTYRWFGSPVGAAIESGAWMSAVALAVWSRRRGRAAFVLASISAGAMIAAQVAWWSFVFPVNQQMLTWTPESLPSNFDELRLQWESTHACRAILQIGALSTATLSSLSGPETKG